MEIYVEENKKMVRLLPQGIPTIKDYESVTNSYLFKEMEDFDGEFLKSINKETMKLKYGDSLHHWSRQYEYPFVLSYINDYITSYELDKKELKILDAGSGFTFFLSILKINIHLLTYIVLIMIKI